MNNNNDVLAKLKSLFSPPPPDDQLSVGQRLSNCMMEVYVGTAVGLSIGTFMTIRTKQTRYFMMGMLGGCLGDALYGYFFKCGHLVLAYREAEAAAKISKKESP